MYFKHIGLMILYLNCGAVFAADPPEAIAPIEYFVATDGQDNWSGKLPAPNASGSDGPFARIERARNAIRDIKGARPGNEYLPGPITVMVRKGTYYLDKTLIFGGREKGAGKWNRRDSGTQKASHDILSYPVEERGEKLEAWGTRHAPITYMAYPGEKVVISGGRPIIGPWKKHRGKIVVCHIPQVQEGNWYFRQLFVNGQRQMRARTPNCGAFYRIVEAIEPDNIEGLDVYPRGFKFNKGDFRNWRNLCDIDVVIFHRWNASRLLVSQVNEEKSIVKFTGSIDRPWDYLDHGIKSAWDGYNRYYIENVFEGLDEPGEWYLDRQTGNLYYWPVDDDIANAQVVAPVLDQLVRFEGQIGAYVQHITLKGFTFSDADWVLPPTGYGGSGDVGDVVEPAAVSLNGVRYCHFEENCIKNVGGYALNITGYGNRIVGNEIAYAGSGGIVMRNFSDKPNVISDNHIHHCGDIYSSGCAIYVDDGGGLISHNHIHHISQSGVMTRSQDQSKNISPERANQKQPLIIEYNKIHDVMYGSHDGAGIWVRFNNNIIRNNLIYDIYSANEGPGSPAWGIYLGCHTSETVVENNVVYRTRAGQLIIPCQMREIGQYDITIRNNVFADGHSGRTAKTHNPSHHNYAQICMSAEGPIPYQNVTFLRNIIYYSIEGDPALFTVSGSEKRYWPTESDYNIVFYTGGETPTIKGIKDVVTFADWQGLGFDAHSLIADPLFVDPAKDDYRLQPESPAFAVGFEPIDMSQVGPRKRAIATAKQLPGKSH
jgi:hypothetical protein